MYYLHMCVDTPSVQETIIELTTKYGFVEPKFVKRQENSSLSYCLQITIPAGNYGRQNFYITEFPGNCSLLVLHDIQAKLGINDEELNEGGQKILKFMEELSKSFNYAGFVVSLTARRLSEFLKNKYGFEPILEELYNPHSGYKNYFLIKKVA